MPRFPALLLLACTIAHADVKPGPSAAKPAHQPRECEEAGDFIRNAALSRDNGMKKEVFISRLEDDLATIRAFPPALRWFARTRSDEAFLLEEARKVFDEPREAGEHRPAVVERCLGRSAE